MSSKLETRVNRDIEVSLDLNARFTNVPPQHSNQSQADAKAALERVMRAYLCNQSSRPYSAAITYVGSFFLQFMSEADAFWLLVAVMHTSPYQVQLLHNTDNYNIFTKHIYAIYAFIRKFNPRLAAHMARIGANPRGYGADNLLYLLTSGMFDFEFVCRVWDIFLYEGWKPVYRIFVSFLEDCADNLFDADDEHSVIETLRSHATRTAMADRGTAILLRAFNYNITKKMIKDMRKNYDSQTLDSSFVKYVVTPLPQIVETVAGEPIEMPPVFEEDEPPQDQSLLQSERDEGSIKDDKDTHSDESLGEENMVGALDTSGYGEPFFNDTTTYNENDKDTTISDSQPSEHESKQNNKSRWNQGAVHETQILGDSLVTDPNTHAIQSKVGEPQHSEPNDEQQNYVEFSPVPTKLQQPISPREPALVQSPTPHPISSQLHPIQRQINTEVMKKTPNKPTNTTINQTSQTSPNKSNNAALYQMSQSSPNKVTTAAHSQMSQSSPNKVTTAAHSQMPQQTPGKSPNTAHNQTPQQALHDPESVLFFNGNSSQLPQPYYPVTESYMSPSHTLPAHSIAYVPFYPHPGAQQLGSPGGILRHVPASWTTSRVVNISSSTTYKRGWKLHAGPSLSMSPLNLEHMEVSAVSVGTKKHA